MKGSDVSLPANLFDTTQDLFLKQHVDFNTILVNYIIENLKSIARLGKSDHVGLVWTFITYSAIDTRVYGGKSYDYWKVNMVAMNVAFHSIKWEEEMGKRGKRKVEIL